MADENAEGGSPSPAVDEVDGRSPLDGLRSLSPLTESGGEG
jgi:hypothetical protein